jgi:Tol biopolymer transport system component
MAGQIWVSDADGQNLRRLTGFSEGFNLFPEWSPDSRYLAFKHVDADDGPLDHGDIWVVASDSEHVRIRDVGNTENAIPLNADNQWLGVFGSFSWR